MYAPLGCGTRSLSFRLHFGADPSKDGFIYGEGQRQKERGLCAYFRPLPFTLLYFLFWPQPQLSKQSNYVYMQRAYHQIFTIAPEIIALKIGDKIANKTVLASISKEMPSQAHLTKLKSSNYSNIEQT